MRELAERAVACKHCRWMEGMGIWIGGSIVKRCVVVGARGPAYRDGYGRLTVVQSALPALDDPATLGCLLALVREAWEPHRGDDSIPSTMQIGNKWAVGTPDGSTLACIALPAFDTEAEALVAALEAAP